MRLLLVRHGQSEGNASGVIQGHLDFGLSELGWRQAELTAKALATVHVDRLLTSPLRRAADTAAVIGGVVGLAAEPVPALLEYNIGAISGLTGPQVRERFPEITAAYARGERPQYPGEEGRPEFLARVSAVLDRLKERDETVVAVAHGGVIGALCYAVTGIEYASRLGMFQVANCSITEVRNDRAGRLAIIRHNDACHLGPLATATDRG